MGAILAVCGRFAGVAVLCVMGRRLGGRRGQSAAVGGCVSVMVGALHGGRIMPTVSSCDGVGGQLLTNEGLFFTTWLVG